MAKRHLIGTFASWRSYDLILGTWFAKWQTWIFSMIIALFSTIGVQAGAHRLWAHRSYKAKLGLL